MHLKEVWDTTKIYDKVFRTTTKNHRQINWNRTKAFYWKWTKNALAFSRILPKGLQQEGYYLRPNIVRRVLDSPKTVRISIISQTLKKCEKYWEKYNITKLYVQKRTYKLFEENFPQDLQYQICHTGISTDLLREWTYMCHMGEVHDTRWIDWYHPLPDLQKSGHQWPK